MDTAKYVVKEFKDVLNTITDSPVDWVEMQVLITATCSVGDVTLRKRLDFAKKDKTWGPMWEP